MGETAETIEELTEDQQAEQALRDAQAARHREKLEFMERIADQIAEKEGVPVPKAEEPPVTEPEPGKNEAAEPGKNEAEAEAGESQSEQEEKPPEQEVVLIVDGKKISVPESKVREAGIRALQKESAADRRLEEATRLLKEARERIEKSPPAAPEGPDPLAAKVARTFFTGGEDEAAQAISELLQARPSLTTEEVMGLVEARLQQERTWASFQEHYQDLVEDPYLMEMTIKEADRMLRSGEPNRWETYQAAGNTVRAWREAMVNKYAPPPRLDELADKLEKKRAAAAASPPPAAATGKHVTPRQDQREESVQDIINSMRKHRGERL